MLYSSQFLFLKFILYGRKLGKDCPIIDLLSFHLSHIPLSLILSFSSYSIYFFTVLHSKVIFNHLVLLSPDKRTDITNSIQILYSHNFFIFKPILFLAPNYSKIRQMLWPTSVSLDSTVRVLSYFRQTDGRT